jgi:hypothetical protein
MLGACELMQIFLHVRKKNTTVILMKISGITVTNFFAQAIWHPQFVHTWLMIV